MENKQLIDYTDKFLTPRSALYAEVQGVQVGCTHLSTRLPLPYGGAHGDTEGQQRYEINTLLDFMDAQEDGSPQVMLGDFNTGPAGLNVEAEYPENYAIIEADDWQNQNVESGDPFATWCPCNTLYVDDGSPISAIDHIFVKNAGV